MHFHPGNTPPNGAFPARPQVNTTLKEIILEFRNECHLGDNVDAVCCRECGEEGVLECEEKEGEIKLVHMLIKRGFGMSPKEAEVVRARSVWKTK